MKDLKYKPIFNKMMAVGKCKNSSALSRALEISPQALTNAKIKGKFPVALVIKFAQDNKISLDWLIGHKGKVPNVEV